MPVHLDDIVTGLQMLGGVLSTPRRIEIEQQQRDIERNLLQGTGMQQADIDAATPQPAMRWLSPQQGGFTGKVLGGVGDVGSLISSIVGKPLAAPRASIEDLAAANKMRTAHAQSLAEDQLLDKMTHGGTPQEIAALGVKSGHGDSAFRYLAHATGSPHAPGSPFAARQRLSTLDPSSDEYKQLKQTLADDEAARAAAADAAAARAEARFAKEHPFSDVSPAQQQHEKFVQLQTDRAAYAKAHNFTPEETPFFLEHGYRQPPAKPARGMTMKDIMTEAARQAAHAAPGGLPPDPDEIRRRGYALADAYTKQGIPIEGFDPSIQPPEAPPSPEKPAEPDTSWHLPKWLGGGGDTPPSTATPPTPSTPPGKTDALPPEWSFLDEIPISTPEQVAQGQQLHQALVAGMPLQAAKNWAIAIGQMPQQQALPR